MNFEVNPGVAELLSGVHSKSSFQGRRYFFSGDLCQRYTAKKEAEKLGIQTDVEGGLPFVMSEEDFHKVAYHLIDNKIDGYWHYSYLTI